MKAIIRVRRPLLTALSLAGVLALGGCGHKEANPTTADTEGPYVRAGNVSYQVQISRQLNPYNVEDRGYLAGVGAAAPKPTQEWFAVFLWAKNETHSNQTTTGRFDIIDTQGTRYLPVRVNPSVNPYAWAPETLKPLGIEPQDESTAHYGATQGRELLFKLDNTIYSNRPLTFEIYAPGQSQPTTISLDL